MIVPDVAHVLVSFLSGHLLCWEGSEQVNGWLLLLAPLKPPEVVIKFQAKRHTTAPLDVSFHLWGRKSKNSSPIQSPEE